MPTGTPKRKRTKEEIAASTAKRLETLAVKRAMKNHNQQVVLIPHSERRIALEILKKILEM